jgi:hypothetical protein
MTLTMSPSGVRKKEGMRQQSGSQTVPSSTGIIHPVGRSHRHNDTGSRSRWSKLALRIAFGQLGLDRSASIGAGRCSTAVGFE